MTNIHDKYSEENHSEKWLSQVRSKNKFSYMIEMLFKNIVLKKLIESIDIYGNRKSIVVFTTNGFL